jgi:hypothetical protein
MRSKRWLVGAIGLTIAVSTSVQAGTDRHLLHCAWSGTVRVVSSTFQGDVNFVVLSGGGRCSGDGSGPYDIGSFAGDGGISTDGGTSPFSMDVTFDLRRASDDVVRSFTQGWSGDASLGGATFTVGSPTATDVGEGSGDVPTIPAPTQQYDAPASFRWTFIHSKLRIPEP